MVLDGQNTGDHAGNCGGKRLGSVLQTARAGSGVGSVCGKRLRGKLRGKEFKLNRSNRVLVADRQ